MTLTPGLVRETLGQDTLLYLGAATEVGQAARGAGQQVSGASQTPTFLFDLPPPEPVLAQNI